MKSNFNKAALTLALIASGFFLQSFVGVRIEKRHYRNGYYVHIWRNPKTQPVHAVAEKAPVKEVKQTVARQEQKISAPSTAAQEDRSIDGPQRNTAPVSRAISQ